jgi:hypothetical protein|tara:strand:+ start:2426 stop:2929 length:504 start_codon:yes stop_codon:yes gene_type:complete
MKNINKMLNDSMNKLKELQEERSEFDKYMEEYRRKSARSQELNKPTLYNTVKAKWQLDYIDYKGTFLDVAKDHITGENFTDLPSSSYESSQFIGTKKQLDDMLSVLYTKPHNEIKIIGSSFMEDIIEIPNFEGTLKDLDDLTIRAKDKDIDHKEVMREYEDYLKSKE